MNRRQFLKLGASGTAVLFAWTPLFAGPAAPAPANLDPRDPDGFSNPLLTPGQEGLLGIFEPQAPFPIQATSAATTILPGKTTDLLVYEVNAGKRFLNPILRVRKGSRLTAYLSDGLQAPITIHWHGLIVNEANDGLRFQAIAPGASYQYDFTVRNRAGTYWYHTHALGATAPQVYGGLASFLLVEDEDELRLRKALDLELGKTDLPLLLQDRRFDQSGNLTYDPTDAERFMGIMGDTILVNLTVKPVLEVAARIYRFRLLNGSNARIYRLAFMRGAAKVGFQIIGVDGGLLAQPAPATELFLGPAERADVLLDLSGSPQGDELYLKSLAFDPMDNEQMGTGAMSGTSGMSGMGLADGEAFYILRLHVGLGPMPPSRSRIPRTRSTITPIDVSRARTRPITLSADPTAMRWYINGYQYDRAQVPLEVRRNGVEIWEIRNEMASMPHPMHIHGFQFQVLQRLNSPAQVAALGVPMADSRPIRAGRTPSWSGLVSWSESHSISPIPTLATRSTCSTVTIWSTRTGAW